MRQIRKQAIRDAKNGNIPAGCDYGTCVLCETDTIIDSKTWICEWCFYNNQ